MLTTIPDTRHIITVVPSGSDKPQYAWLASCTCGWQALIISEENGKYMGESHHNIRAARERQPDAQ